MRQVETGASSFVLKLIAVLALAHFMMESASGQEQLPDATVSAAQSETKIDVDVIEAAFDRLLGEGGKTRFTGAVVTVVKDGSVVLSKGYGLEDVENSTPVDPNTTRFRVASVSKTMIGAMAGIAIDEGVIEDFDQPFNGLVSGFDLPPNRGEEITLRMLATHNAGFAERRQAFMQPGEGFPAFDPAYLEAQRPPYIRPANSGAVYSNYGSSLLAIATASALGGDYFQLAEDKILKPVGMSRSDFALAAVDQPGDADIEAFYPDGRRVLIPNEWHQNPMVAPAGGLAATGGDIGRYMIALLGGSTALDIPPLHSDETRELIFSRLGGTHPALQEFGAMFMIFDWNGTRVVEHGGRTLGTTSMMQLLPDDGLGVFVSVTGEGGRYVPFSNLTGNGWPQPASGAGAGPLPAAPGLLDLRAVLLEALYGPWRPQAFKQGALRPLVEFKGVYRGERRQVRATTALFQTFFFGDGALRIKVEADNTLQIGRRSGYRQIAPDVFYRPAEGEPSGWFDMFAFQRDADGNVASGSWYYTDAVYERVDGFADPAIRLQMFLASALVLITGVFAFFWAPAAPGRLSAIATPILLLATPFIYLASWPDAPAEALSYVWTRPRSLVGLQLSTNLVCVSALLTILAAMWMWSGERASGMRAVFARWHAAVIASAALFFLASAWAFGWIGWNVAN